MHLNFLAFAIPLFLSLMLVEYYFSKRKKLQLFNFEETIANLNVGIAERLSDLFTTGIFYFFFDILYRHFAIFNIRPGFIAWLLLFLATDFVWYWYHRCGHRINLFWSMHVVHHQSDDFNYTASVRITIFQAAARCLFWSVLPILGFPPGMITLFLLIHGTYPFFTHTQLIGKLGLLEKILVTPSHHRVHHSSNEEYLDKNYGDILIIWDKLFGTFAEEKTTPVFGLTKPINSHSFLWQHFHFMLELWISLKMAAGLRNKLAVLFGKPDDIDPRIRIFLEKKFNIQQRHHSSTALNNYAIVQTITTLVLLFILLLLEYYLNPFQLSIAAMFIIVSLVNTGAMLEQRRWIFYLEYVRLMLVGIFITTYSHSEYTVSFLVAVLAIVLMFYKTLSTRYYNFFFSYA